MCASCRAFAGCPCVPFGQVRRQILGMSEPRRWPRLRRARLGRFASRPVTDAATLGSDCESESGSVWSIPTRTCMRSLSSRQARVVSSLSWRCRRGRRVTRRRFVSPRRSLPAGAFAIEGTGSYGSGLACFLEEAGERVLEVGRLPREGRRSRAKSDALNAIRAARAVLGADRLALPRAGGRRQELRSLVVSAERGLCGPSRPAFASSETSSLPAPSGYAASWKSLSRARLLRRCLGLRPAQRRDGEGRGSLLALRLLAGRLQALTREERELAKEIRTLVSNAAPERRLRSSLSRRLARLGRPVSGCPAGTSPLGRRLPGSVLWRGAWLRG